MKASAAKVFSGDTEDNKFENHCTNIRRDTDNLAEICYFVILLVSLLFSIQSEA